MASFSALAVMVLAVWLGWSVPVHASAYALLVGVSDYDESIGLSDLRGPANDVRLLRDVLNERGDFTIRVLADGVEGAEIPTRDAILNAMDGLAETVIDGDFVYIHFSGHGTQQADRGGDETDGMDEVFLPSDTARAAPGTAVIPNAIVDEEIGQRIAAMRARGADVWFVLDSCHSGSGLRAGSPRVASRFVDPAVLGVAQTALPETAATPAVEGPGGEDLPGGYLAFYAAQSSELAREIQIDEASDDSWYGLFTSRLAARLQSEGALTYRQLFQAVLSDLNEGVIPGAARLQTPLAEGTLLDAPVFGGGDVVGVRQFPVAGGRISAGKLQGLIDNTVVSLVTDAAAPADAVLAYAQLERTSALDARLVMVGADCLATVDAPCARIGALPEAARFARIVSRPLDTVLRIAPPSDLSTGRILAPDHPLAAALAEAVVRANATYGTRIELDGAGMILSGALDGALWFGERLTIGQSPIGLRWAPEEGPLDPYLLRIAKAEELARTLTTVAGAPSLLFPSPVEIQVERLSADPGQLTVATPVDLNGVLEECALARQYGVATGGLPEGQGLKQCDEVAFGARGVVQGPARDVNRVYIDSQFCASAVHKRVEGVALPAIIGDSMNFCADCPTESGMQSKAGVERLFFIVTEANANSEPLNLQGLIDTCGEAAASTRSAGVAQAEGLLQALGSQDATRGSFGAIGIARIWVEKFSWYVLPRREALAQAGRDVGQ
ncbi:MAG: caspase family protein [Pseudomonadota bacterium]